jgi:hypothetical protein
MVSVFFGFPIAGGAGGSSNSGKICFSAAMVLAASNGIKPFFTSSMASSFPLPSKKKHPRPSRVMRTPLRVSFSIEVDGIRKSFRALPSKELITN